MEKPRTPTLAGYDLAIERVKELHHQRTGKEHGAISWLAAELGTSRQTVDNWGDRTGFPINLVPKVSEITGLPPETIRPATVILEIPKSAWAGICMRVTKNLTNQAIIITDLTERAWANLQRKPRKSKQ